MIDIEHGGDHTLALDGGNDDMKLHTILVVKDSVKILPFKGMQPVGSLGIGVIKGDILHNQGRGKITGRPTIQPRGDLYPLWKTHPSSLAMRRHREEGEG